METINQRRSGSLKGCYIRQKGRIFLWGAFRVYANSVINDTNMCSPDYGGGWYWSEKLPPYGNEEYYAKLSNNKVIVFRRKGRRKMAVIPACEVLYLRDVYEVVVSRNGYLSFIGAYGLGMSDLSRAHKDNDRYMQALDKALKGKKPGVYDGSPFTQVSPALKGKVLIELSFDYIDWKADSRLVFTKEGEVVISSTDTPISYERWGIPKPAPSWPSDDGFTYSEWDMFNV